MNDLKQTLEPLEKTYIIIFICIITKEGLFVVPVRIFETSLMLF